MKISFGRGFVNGTIPFGTQPQKLQPQRTQRAQRESNPVLIDQNNLEFLDSSGLLVRGEALVTKTHFSSRLLRYSMSRLDGYGILRRSLVSRFDGDPPAGQHDRLGGVRDSVSAF